jgi:hypothetical protein
MMDLDQHSRVDLEHIIERQRPVIEAAKKAPHEIKSILESLAFSPPENYPLHLRRFAELANYLHEAVEALEAAEEE